MQLHDVASDFGHGTLQSPLTTAVEPSPDRLLRNNHLSLSDICMDPTGSAQRGTDYLRVTMIIISESELYRTAKLLKGGYQNVVVSNLIIN